VVAARPEAHLSSPAVGDPLRVLHVDTGRTWRGGQRQALLLALELRARGHESICAFEARGPLARAGSEAGLVMVPFRCHGEWDAIAALRLRRVVRERRPHLLHAHDGHATAMALVAGRGVVPVVASRRTAFAPRRHLVNRLKLRAVRRWLAISPAARRGLLRAGVDPHRVDVVPSGIPPGRAGADDLPAVPLRAALGIRADSFVVLTAGRLEPLKGQRIFLEACALAGDLGNTRWVVAGDGPDRTFLERLATALGLGERAVFARHLADLPRHVGECQVFVLASFREGLGTALLDAAAAGVPLVAAAGSGVSEVIEDGVQGFLVPPGDARSVAEAVRLLYLDPSRRREMGARARDRAAAFSLDASVERTLASYAAALGSPPDGHPGAGGRSLAA
jgi:glycosyltransferase involved in cell wall biosynthesis